MIDLESFGGVVRLLGPPLLACVACAALAAPIPDAVSKLAGSTDEVARSTMTQNGYVPRGEKTSWGRKLGLWWNARSRQCVQLTVLAGRVVSVHAKGESDCAAPNGGATAGDIDPLQLVGLPRQAAEARLMAAGFHAQSIDESKPEGIYVTWLNDRQCLYGLIVADRVQQLSSCSK